MQLNYSTHGSLFFTIVPKHTDEFVPCWHEFKNSFTVGIGLLHLQAFWYSHFHILIILEFGDLPDVASAVKTVASMVWKLPVKQLRQFSCLICAVWDCIFLLKAHTAGQIISWAYWSNILEVTNIVVMRKWPYVNDLKCKNPVYTVAEFWNLCQGGINASVYTKIRLKNNDTSVE